MATSGRLVVGVDFTSAPCRRKPITAAVGRLREIRGEGTPAIVLAVYGNRSFGTAVAELASFVAERGFVPVAAGAFVGEHSYSTPETSMTWLGISTANITPLLSMSGFCHTCAVWCAAARYRIIPATQLC